MPNKLREFSFLSPARRTLGSILLTGLLVRLWRWRWRKFCRQSLGYCIGD